MSKNKNATPRREVRPLNLTEIELEIVGMLVDFGDIPGFVLEQGWEDEYRTVCEKIRRLEE